MRGAEVLLIAGVSALLDAAVARAASSARAAHPPTENMRVRLVPFGSTGAMFHFRNMVGAVAPLGQNALSTDARCTAESKRSRWAQCG